MKQKRRFSELFSVIFISILFISACNASKVPNDKSATLKSIAKKYASFEGKEIQLEGLYLGWKHADCEFPASFLTMQVTRSDWAFSDGKRCCFVTGTIPKGFESSPEKPVPIVLTAIVRLSNSKVYLEFVNAQLKQ